MALGMLQYHELLGLAEADPHQLYPEPPLLVCTSPVCPVWPLSPRATTKPSCVPGVLG